MQTARVATLLLGSLAACSDDPTAVCRGSEPVHLLPTSSPDWRGVAAHRAGDYTFLRGLDERGYTPTFAGAACGVEPTPLFTGISLLPLRLHADPHDDDPTIACDPFGGALFRVDPGGEAAPTLLLSHLRCTSPRLTDHGVLFPGSLGGSVWLYPAFPEATGARRITTTLHWRASGPLTLVGDELVYIDEDGSLRIHDLGAGTEQRPLERVARFSATPTHILWREATDDTTAPVRLYTRASGASRDIGVHDAELDDLLTGRNSLLRDAWGFDPTGEFVLHVPGAPDAPMQAFDLTGAPVEFPRAGRPWHFFADGTLLFTFRGRYHVVRPGGAAVTLALPSGTDLYGPFGERIEVRLGGDLHEVPLDGAPPRVLARDVGSRWTWLDDTRLLTTVYGELTVIDGAGERRALAESVREFSVVPDDGVYFTIMGAADDRRNGLWYLPAAGLRGAPEPE